METAGEGGPYGMALLAAFLLHGTGTLEDFLEREVFAGAKAVTVEPDRDDAAGFASYLEAYQKGLAVEREAVREV